MFVYIHLRDGKTLRARAMYSIGDEFAFIDETTGKESRVSFVDIKTISAT